jgi:hypothetical protein
MLLLGVDRLEAERLEKAGGGPIAAAVRIHGEERSRG